MWILCVLLKAGRSQVATLGFQMMDSMNQHRKSKQEEWQEKMTNISLFSLPRVLHNHLSMADQECTWDRGCLRGFSNNLRGTAAFQRTRFGNCKPFTLPWACKHQSLMHRQSCGKEQWLDAGALIFCRVVPPSSTSVGRRGLIVNQVVNQQDVLKMCSLVVVLDSY